MTNETTVRFPVPAEDLKWRLSSSLLCAAFDIGIIPAQLPQFVDDCIVISAGSSDTDVTFVQNEKSDAHVVLTGHMHVGSIVESYDDCGNCGGANCDICRREVRTSRVVTADLYLSHLMWPLKERIFRKENPWVDQPQKKPTFLPKDDDEIIFW